MPWRKGLLLTLLTTCTTVKKRKINSIMYIGLIRSPKTNRISKH
jgi:hypothetical protein